MGGGSPIGRGKELTLEGGEELGLLSEERLESAFDLLDGLCRKERGWLDKKWRQRVGEVSRATLTFELGLAEDRVVGHGEGRLAWGFRRGS